MDGSFLQTLTLSLMAPLVHVAGSPLTHAEALGFLLALGMVFCNIRASAWSWPLAIASSALYALLYWNQRLPGQAGLQIFFIAMALWGWWEWLRPQPATEQKRTIDSMAHRERLWALVFWLGLCLLLGLGLSAFIPSQANWLDAFTTAGSIVGTWLLGRKLLENWAVWLVVNLFSTVLFAWQGLWLTTLLYLLFCFLSLKGWLAWKNSLHKVYA
jgi:nicotinamide mononucleotide transporter